MAAIEMLPVSQEMLQFPRRDVPNRPQRQGFHIDFDEILQFRGCTLVENLTHRLHIQEALQKVALSGEHFNDSCMLLQNLYDGLTLDLYDRRGYFNTPIKNLVRKANGILDPYNAITFIRTEALSAYPNYEEKIAKLRTERPTKYEEKITELQQQFTQHYLNDPIFQVLYRLVLERREKIKIGLRSKNPAQLEELDSDYDLEAARPGLQAEPSV